MEKNSVGGMMQKYCKILDYNTGLVQLGAGCSDEYYRSIGMKLRDVDKSEKDNQWYLKDKCPHYTEEEKEKMRENNFNRSFFNTSLGYIRRSVTMADGSHKDFLSDLLPVISMGVQGGKSVEIITYDKPPFDADITDWTPYQHHVTVTPQFIQECFLQLSNDFLPSEG